MSTATQSPKSTGLDAPRSAATQPSRLVLAAFVLIFLAACALRIDHIGRRSLWLDEAIAANISRGTWAQAMVLIRGIDSAPVIHPFILYAVERAPVSATTVRLPSMLASAAAVLVLLLMGRIPSYGYHAAGLSALMMSLSAFQIRYAQEVREYSLAVLFAALMVYAFLSYADRRGARLPILLCLVLAVCPLVQYGLVLLGGSVLVSLGILALASRNWRSIVHILIAGASLGAGGITSFLLTLRYQWGGLPFYLVDYFYAPGKGLLHFAVTNTHHLVTSFLPGFAISVLAIASVAVDAVLSVRRKSLSALTILAFVSVGTVLACSILQKYPFGAIRQCIFLSPILLAYAGYSLTRLARLFPGRMETVVFAAIACVAILSGTLQIRSQHPYAEIEDMHQVFAALDTEMRPGDAAYIYPGAVPAVDFYIRNRDPRFIYGNYHQQDRQEYVPEIEAGAGAGAERVWVVLSHVYQDEDQRILADLARNWKVEPAVSAKGSALYLAQRRRPQASTAGSESSQAPQDAAARGGDFWQWNLRNCDRDLCHTPEAGRL